VTDAPKAEEHTDPDDEWDDAPAGLTEPPRVPRWTQVLSGLFLGPLAILCIVGTIAVWRLPTPASPALFYPIMAALLGGSLWVLAKSVRLIAGWEARGNLIGPTGLEVFAWLFVLMPITSVAIGYFQEGRLEIDRDAHPLLTALRIMMVIAVFVGVRRLAAARRRRTP
jgi:hypothetical protein